VSQKANQIMNFKIKWLKFKLSQNMGVKTAFYIYIYIYIYIRNQQKEKGDKDQNLLQQKTKKQQERKSNPKYK
jgi:hypothetical protein